MTEYGSEAPSIAHSPYLLSSSAATHMAIAPSVFSPYGWVHRHLRPSEFLRVLDVPKSLDSFLLSSDGIFLDSAIGVALLQSVPGKVVLRVLKHLGYTLSTPTFSVLPALFTSDYASHIQGDFNPVTEQQTDVHISVKADGAAVPVGLWNAEIFAGLDVALCYELALHDALLERLRDLWGMRWYRKQLFSSF